jgi:hypothetical protein
MSNAGMIVWVPGENEVDLETKLKAHLDTYEWVPEGGVFIRKGLSLLWQKLVRVDKDNKRTVECLIIKAPDVKTLLGVIEEFVFVGWEKQGEHILHEEYLYQTVVKTEMEE